MPKYHGYTILVGIFPNILQPSSLTSHKLLLIAHYSLLTTHLIALPCWTRTLPPHVQYLTYLPTSQQPKHTPNQTNTHICDHAPSPKTTKNTPTSIQTTSTFSISLAITFAIHAHSIITQTNYSYKP